MMVLGPEMTDDFLILEAGRRIRLCMRAEEALLSFNSAVDAGFAWICVW